MTLYHGAQVLLLVGVVAIVVERVRTLGFVSHIDIRPLRARLRALLADDQTERAAELLSAALPAWPAHCALALVGSGTADEERLGELDERLMDARVDAVRWLRALRVSATIASALGFIGAAIQIYWIFNVDHGLASLEAGRVENAGLAKAMLSIAIGISTSSLALGSWSVLRKAANERIKQCRRLAAAVEEGMGGDLG